jgi:Rad52/22 family double-strand break repair protein
VTALTDTQVRSLKAKLDAKHVKTRISDGATLSYVEGWHVIAEANRIFGYDAWDRRTVSTNCVSTTTRAGLHHTSYIAKVRVTVRAGDTIIVREGSGSCEAAAPTVGQAHDVALKGAETDATKRALATFGNPFGLALYDREQLGVRKPRGEKTSAAIGPWLLRSVTGAEEASFNKPSEFADALRKAMTEAKDIELLFAVWELNVDTVRALNRSLKQNQLSKSGIAPQLVNYLKQCAIALVKPDSQANSSDPKTIRSKIDKSVLTFGELKRIRSKEHLRFVAEQPCLICGRSPSHAHHIRYAQPRGLGLKVSDEFTVPLCAIHHSENHATGDERHWWQKHGLDPLSVARRLWQESHFGGLGRNAKPTIESDEKKPISG